MRETYVCWIVYRSAPINNQRHRKWRQNGASRQKWLFFGKTVEKDMEMKKKDVGRTNISLLDSPLISANYQK